MRDRPKADRRDRGETLVEIVLTIVITSITITALISALATTGSASGSQRNSVSTDVVMRNFAEATKAAARTCVATGTYSVAYTPPVDFTAEPRGASACPSPTVTKEVVLTVTGPGGMNQSMTIKVRTP